MPVRCGNPRTPGLAPGVLFFCAWLFAGPAPGQLAAELLSEGDWLAARREALREIAARPNDDRALLVAAVASLRIADAGDALAMLDHLAAEAADPALRAAAAYERGQALWSSGDAAGAMREFARALRAEPAGPLALQAACALGLAGDVAPVDPALALQIRSLLPLFTTELREKVRPPAKPESRLAAKPAEWIVRLYKNQIAPAIGHRCSLHPSCSAYFVQASREHGWLGIPLIGDRLVREPGVVSAAERPVEHNGRVLFADPLSDHVHE